jgi:hypothetical protein
MELLSLNIKNFKNIFFQAIIIDLVAIITSYFVVSNGFSIIPLSRFSRTFTLPVLLVLIILGVFHTQRQKKQLDQLGNIADFDEKVAGYEKIYKGRLHWFLFSCLVCCLVHVLTARMSFLYYAIIDMALSLPYYPNKILFQKDLKSDEIILY